ncbi:MULTISPECIES: hypothetical protein [Stutzerimonas stutzeri group]|uniref:hypothetical protein n=1 Tax=Stutzerimonas stutzeri group TaxID=136846 RepID=UPI00141F7844|nr:hypothetical protein [Stutzerimonas degradans]NHW01950.1 hypothetical protein [Stutzerimonas degradans]
MKKPNTYTLRILGSAPDKLPLDRLALYLAELAKLMGENKHIHFDRLSRGSAALKVWAEPEAAPDVAKRVTLSVKKSSNAPKDALRALDRINELLVEDGKKAELKNPDGAVIYPFPGGRKVKPMKELQIDEDCTVSGQIIKIGGKDETIPLLLRDSDGIEYHCTVKGSELAREISSYYLRDPIEVSGKGKWRRTQDGTWVLEQLMVKSWAPLSTDWDTAFEAMSRLAGGWRDVPDIDERCASIRKGH